MKQFTFDEKEIAKNLKKYLAKSKVQQKELAVACNKSVGTISHWVDGRVTVPVKYLPVICELLDITFYDLLGIPNPSLLSAEEEKVIAAYRKDEEFKIIVKRVLRD